MPFLAPVFAYIGTATGVAAAGATATAAATAGVMVVGTAASIAGAGYSAYSSYQSGKAQERINNYNAKIAEQDAADKQRDGRILANAQRAAGERMMSRQRALYGKSGTVGGVGSPLMVQAEQAGQLEMAALDVQRNANAQAGKLRQQAVADRMAGRAARQAGSLNAAGTLLQGAGNAMGNYAAFKGAGTGYSNVKKVGAATSGSATPG